MTTTRIDNGRVYVDGDLQPLSILLDGERIAALYHPDLAPNIAADEVIDATGCWLLPAGIDMHVHISDGAETFSPGSRCAAAGGIGTVLDMAPFHGCVTPEQFQAKVEAAGAAYVVDFGLVAGIVVSLEDLPHLAELADLGAPYFKVFMPGQPPVTPEVLWQAVQAAGETGLRLGLHAEESGCLAEVDWDDPLGFAHARPIAAESSATAQVLEMARAAGAPVHICHVSSVQTAELIAEAKDRGVDVTAEIPMHFLLFDENEFLRQGARVKTTPPLRPEGHQALLWQALNEGVIDVLACDHFLGTLDEVPTDPAQMQDAAAGIASLELSLPLLFSDGVQEGKLDLARFVEATAEWPAEIAGLASRKGRIAVGLDADFVFFDPQAEWQVAPQGAFSRNANSPYLGRQLQGRITRTMLRGQTVWDGEQILVEDGYGQHIRSREQN